MTTEPYTYTDPDGDILHVSMTGEWLRLDIEDAGNSAAAVMTAVLIAATDVRKVTAAMHAKAGLPDRWAELRAWAGAGHAPWCADVLARMDELEAGR